MRLHTGLNRAYCCAGVASNKLDVAQVAHIELRHGLGDGKSALDAASPIHPRRAVVVLVALARVARERGRLIDAGCRRGSARETDAAVNICVKLVEDL